MNTNFCRRVSNRSVFLVLLAICASSSSSLASNEKAGISQAGTDQDEIILGSVEIIFPEETSRVFHMSRIETWVKCRSFKRADKYSASDFHSSDVPGIRLHLANNRQLKEICISNLDHFGWLLVNEYLRKEGFSSLTVDLSNASIAQAKPQATGYDFVIPSGEEKRATGSLEVVLMRLEKVAIVQFAIVRIGNQSVYDALKVELDEKSKFTRVIKKLEEAISRNEPRLEQDKVLTAHFDLDRVRDELKEDLEDLAATPQSDFQTLRLLDAELTVRLARFETLAEKVAIRL